MPREQRRAQLIDVALDVFAERSFAQTTMDEIAHRAAVSKPVLYQHFKNKRALYFSLIDQQLDALRDRITTAMQTVDPTAATADEDTAYQAVRGIFEFTSDPRGLYRLILDTSMKHPEEVEARKEQFVTELVELISPYILDNSILDAAASKFITRGIASAVMVLAMHWAEEFRNNNAAHSTMTLEAAVNHTCRLVAHGAIGFDLANNPSA